MLTFSCFGVNKSEKQSEIDDLANSIKHGESEYLEFKSSLRWDFELKKNNKVLQNEVLLTIAAFCNSKGGQVLIGIADDGTTLGIQHDGFPNADSFLRHLTNLLRDRIWPNVADFVAYEMVTLEGNMVCRVTCKKSNRDIWLKMAKNSPWEFFIRRGPTSESLNTKDAVEYVKDHFE